MPKTNACVQRYPERVIVADEVDVVLEPDELGGIDHIELGQ